MTEALSGVGIFAALLMASLIEAALPFCRSKEAPDGRRRADMILTGASPVALIFYRTMSAANAVLEHENVMAPTPFARAMSRITSWPHYHKIHHSAASPETESNYDHLLSMWNCMFATHTPVEHAAAIVYGLGAAHKHETVAELLVAPFLHQQWAASNDE